MADKKTNIAAAKAARQEENPHAPGVEILKGHRANEFFLGIVAPAGAGSGTAASVLANFLKASTVDGQPIEVAIIKASHAIREWAETQNLPVPTIGPRKSLDDMIMMQDRGDDMRKYSSDNAAVARAVMRMIREERSRLSNQPPGIIDGKPRAYIIDSLRHPDEVFLLRNVYQDAFALIGVIADPDQRNRRLRDLFDVKDRNEDTTLQKVSDFMIRDANAPSPHGQHVTAAFHESDFFVDNSEDAENDDLKKTAMNEPIRRFINLLTGERVLRPSIDETAMHHAHSAKLRSACMSRQVGAAVVDKQGNIVSTGTNEVPKAGGGVYGETPGHTHALDLRCIFMESPFCSSNKEQNEIIGELIEAFPQILDGKNRDAIFKKIRKTSLGGLIEFSRAVHAEMDALLSAARIGVTLVGSRLYVSTYPCHYCARHIVSAGVDEVQYIEPYPKSRALKLHNDSITTTAKGWIPPSQQTASFEKAEGKEKPQPKVLFRPFVGVAPRMYQRAFLKDRSYKDEVTGDFRLSAPLWGAPANLSAVHYTDLEVKLGGVAS